MKSILQACAKEFPGALFVFDTLPELFSKKTLKKKWKLTRNYTFPKMPWGINCDRIKKTIHDWVPTVDEVVIDNRYNFTRGLSKWVSCIWHLLPKSIINRHTATVTRIRFGN